MELSEMQARAAELEQLIADLPAGSITKKTVNGKEYFYHRWTEDKKRREKYIPADELEDFRAQIEQRKALERELKALKKQLPKGKSVDTSAFTTNVRTGEALHSFASPVRAYRKREYFRQLHDYIYGGQQDKVFILYGLRRTGKTTMIRQIFAEMSEAELAKVAFIQITARDTLADVNRDLKLLEAQGFRYVFLDEVTLMEDFIEGAALFSDVFAACGMKTVLSGADSMGFLFAEDEQLYDRCILYDYNDIKIDNPAVRSKVKTVQATLPVKTSKEVDLVVNFVPAAGSTLVTMQYTVSPDKVTLVGEKDVLDTIDAIVLDTLYLQDLQPSQSLTYSVTAPEGTTLAENVGPVTVTIVVTGVTERNVTVTAFHCENVPEGFSAVPVTESLNILLRGLENEMAQITAEDLRITVDLSGITEPGVHTVPVTVQVANYANVGVKGSYQIVVDVERLP